MQVAILLGMVLGDEKVYILEAMQAVQDKKKWKKVCLGDGMVKRDGGIQEMR